MLLSYSLSSCFASFSSFCKPGMTSSPFCSAKTFVVLKVELKPMFATSPSSKTILTLASTTVFMISPKNISSPLRSTLVLPSGEMAMTSPTICLTMAILKATICILSLCDIFKFILNRQISLKVYSFKINYFI